MLVGDLRTHILSRSRQRVFPILSPQHSGTLQGCRTELCGDGAHVGKWGAYEKLSAKAAILSQFIDSVWCPEKSV